MFARDLRTAQWAPQHHHPQHPDKAVAVHDESRPVPWFCRLLVMGMVQVQVPWTGSEAAAAPVVSGQQWGASKKSTKICEGCPRREDCNDISFA
jgi:hypothetical protein